MLRDGVGTYGSVPGYLSEFAEDHRLMTGVHCSSTQDKQPVWAHGTCGVVQQAHASRIFKLP